eukprot:NODE_75_length_23955_cov_0.435069.p27 type:complete len:106 gc:universal NODE_75_length_23955_cov_0.435069:3792-3475(-)
MEMSPKMEMRLYLFVLLAMVSADKPWFQKVADPEINPLLKKLPDVQQTVKTIIIHNLDDRLNDQSLPEIYRNQFITLRDSVNNLNPDELLNVSGKLGLDRNLINK